MNEKVQEFMLAAGIKGRYAFPYGDNLDECVNKFVELLVRECAYTAWINGMDEYKKILEHFNIE